MTIDFQKILPLLISIGILILVAILRNTSRTVAAIVATMPINIPLALYVFSGGENVTQQSLVDFLGSMIVGLIPSFFFLIAAYFAAREGLTTFPTIIVGYIAWGITLGIILGIQSLFKA